MRPVAGLVVSFLAVVPIPAADPWPAEDPAQATNLTAIEGPAPNDFYVDMSGAFWNPKARRLWVERDGPSEDSKLWALVPTAGGSFEVEYRDGDRGEWTGFGNLEDVTQVDLDADIVYAIVEGEEHVKAYDVAGYGTAVLLRDWDLEAHLPFEGGRGAEGLTFVPDRFLTAAGFVGSDGAPCVSARGMGGLMLVGHQNGGAVFAFDLDPASDEFAFVGEYRTGYNETAALHFDRSNGRLYIWHDDIWDTLEVTDLSSTPVTGESARTFRTVRAFDGPHHRNNEGLALTTTDDCADGFRSAFLVTDGGGINSLTWFKQFADGCATLTVNKSPGSGTVDLSWNNGVAPHTLLRAEAPTLIEGRTVLLDQSPATTLSDPVLSDSKSYFYLVP